MTGRRHVGDASATRRPRGQLSEHRRQRCRRLLAGSFSGEDCHSPNEFNMRALKLSQYCYCTEREAALTGAPFPRSGDLFPCSSSASPVLGRRRWPEEDRPAPPGFSLSRPRSSSRALTYRARPPGLPSYLPPVTVTQHSTLAALASVTHTNKLTQRLPNFVRRCTGMIQLFRDTHTRVPFTNASAS